METPVSLTSLPAIPPSSWFSRCSIFLRKTKFVSTERSLKSFQIHYTNDIPTQNITLSLTVSHVSTDETMEAKKRRFSIETAVPLTSQFAVPRWFKYKCTVDSRPSMSQNKACKQRKNVHCHGKHDFIDYHSPVRMLC